MTGRAFWRLDEVSDAELDGNLRSLLEAGTRTEARIIAHLAEVEARRTHLKAGHSSLFGYCLEHLGLSETEAFHRITVARLARRYPMIFELLEQRRLHLSAVCAVRKHINDENHADLLEQISGRSKREIEQLLAARFPTAPSANKLRKLPRLDPLSADTYRLELTIDAELKADLELARDLMTHSNPCGDLSVVLARGTKLLLQKLQAERFGVTAQSKLKTESRPVDNGAAPNQGARSEAVPPQSFPRQRISERPISEQRLPAQKRAHIARATRREVAARDASCCSFVSKEGKRCESRAFLQFHHHEAWAEGGADSAENLSLFCAAHNQLLAEQEFGAEQIKQTIAFRQHSSRNK